MDATSLPMPPAACAQRFDAPLRRRVVALIIAAAVAGLVFAAYRQPDLILGFSAFGLC